MSINKGREKLLLRLIYIIADIFKNDAVLKGGMCLRLLNSPRSTQDVDYILSGKPSRKTAFARLKKSIEKESDLEISKSQLHSRGIIVVVKDAMGELAQIEISIIENLLKPPEQLATSSLASLYNMPGRVITVMSLAESYANKIAACLERDVLRDLYDLNVFRPLTKLDKEVLNIRLQKLVVRRSKPIAIDFKEAANRLKKKVENLNDEKLEKELSGLVPEEFFKGGALIIKNCVYNLCMELENI